MTQYGFYFDMNSCIGCRTCQIACKDKNDLAIGTLFRQVRSFETGEFPKPGFYHYSSTCNHCTAPACITACPTDAISKDMDTGIVLVDEAECTNCGLCKEACPYDVPQIDTVDSVMKKCDMCQDLIEAGEQPVCIDACIMRCLEWGDIDELKFAHSDAVTATVLYPDDSTAPNGIISLKPAATEEVFVQKLV